MSDDEFKRTVLERFVAQDKRFDNLDASFIKLFKYMTERFDKLETVVATKADTDKVYTMVANLASHAKDAADEQAALKHQQNCHQAWIEQLATATGTKLNPQ